MVLGRKIILTILSAALLMVVFTCGKPAEELEKPPEAAPEVSPEPVATAKPEPVEEKLEPVEVKGYTQAMVTFFSGEVTVLREGDYESLEIGDLLDQETVLKVGDDSFCEVQFGDMAVVRVQQKTELALSTIFMRLDEKKIGLEMAAGSILCKVGELGKKDSFKVRTATAAFGVRGTEFVVRVTEDRKTRLAVKTGKVAVLPPTADIEQMKEKVKGKSQELIEIIEKIETAAPVVGASQEIEIGEETLKETEELFREIEAVIVEEVERAEKSEQVQLAAEVITRIEKKIEVAVRSVQESVEPPREITEESASELEVLEIVRMIELPPPVEETEERKKEEAAKPEDAKPAPVLVKIVIQVEPKDAEIWVNGDLMGRGAVAGIYNHGDHLTVALKKPGFDEETLQITVAKGEDRSVKVTLQETRQRIEITARPADAEILLDGERVGRGRYIGEFAPGKRLTFLVRKAGYVEESLTISVRRGMQGIYTFSLQQEKERIEITAQPGDAEILLNGKPVGRGRYSAEFALGERLTFRAQRNGYTEESLSLTVKRGMQSNYILELKEIKERVLIIVSPANAEIFLDGEKVGRGRYTGEFLRGRRLVFVLKKDGYEDLSFTVSEGMQRYYNIELQQKRETIEVSVRPADAVILLDGERVGQGRHTADYVWGRKLVFVAGRPGYEDKSIDVTVSEHGRKSFNIELERSTEEIGIRADPADAEIVLNGRKVGTGSFSGQFAVGEQLSFVIKRDGYNERTLTLSVSPGTGRVYEINLAEQKEVLKISVKPYDAEIYLDGRLAGRGSYSDLYVPGTSLSLKVAREEYFEESRTIQVRRGAPNAISVSLEPMPITRRFSLSAEAIKGEIGLYGERIVAADRKGVLFAAGMRGQRHWSVQTGNSPNENSFPVIIGDRAYFSGSNEFVIVEVRSGRVSGRQDLDSNASHLFGRRTVSDGTNGYFPANDAIRVIDLSSGLVLRSISLPNGSGMTPTLYQDKILIVDNKGVFLIIDRDSGRIESQIRTRAIQPIALAATVQGDRAFFAGRKGSVVSVDLSAKKVAWERGLPGDRRQGIFQDIICSPEGAFVFAKDTLYGFSMQTGEELFTPVAGISAPPLYMTGKLYVGSADGSFLILDAKSGRTVNKLEVGARITTRPAELSGKIIVGTAKGEILVLNPAGIR